MPLRTSLIGRRNFMRFGTLGIATAATTGLLASCSKSDNGSSSGPLPSPKDLSRVAMQGIIDDNIPGDAQQKTLPIWEKKSGMKVDFQLLSEQQVFQKAGSVLSGKRETPVGVVTGEYSQMLQWAKAEWIAPIDAYMGDSRYTPRDELDKSDFFKAYWDLGTARDGKRYAFPFFASTKLLAYRRDILAKYDLQPPDTFDDLLNVCKTLKSHNIAAIAMRGASGVSAALWPFGTFFYGEGANYFVDYPKDLHLNIASDEAVKALTLYTEILTKYSVPGVANYDFPQVRGAFIGGKVAMILDEAQGIGLMHQPSVNPHAKEVSTAIVPKGPAGRFAGINTQMLLIPRHYTDVGAAYRYTLWVTSSEGQLATALQGNGVAVTRPSVMDNEKVKKKYDYDNGQYLKNFKNTLANYAKGPLGPPVVVAPQIQQALGAAVSSCVAGDSQPAAALKQAQDQGNQALKQAGLIK